MGDKVYKAAREAAREIHESTSIRRLDLPMREFEAEIISARFSRLVEAAQVVGRDGKLISGIWPHNKALHELAVALAEVIGE